MPSPASTAAFYVRQFAAKVSQFVEAVQQAVPREGFDREGDADAVRQGHPCGLQIHDHFGAWIVQQPRVRRGVDHHREQTVLERVTRENVGNGRADDGAEAVIQQRPRRVFARRAAAEIVARDQYGRAGRRRLIQDEFRIRRPIRQIAPVGEQRRPQSGMI